MFPKEANAREAGPENAGLRRVQPGLSWYIHEALGIVMLENHLGDDIL